jgi:hypothetical protein
LQCLLESGFVSHEEIAYAMKLCNEHRRFASIKTEFFCLMMWADYVALMFFRMFMKVKTKKKGMGLVHGQRALDGVKKRLLIKEYCSVIS